MLKNSEFPEASWTEKLLLRHVVIHQATRRCARASMWCCWATRCTWGSRHRETSSTRQVDDDRRRRKKDPYSGGGECAGTHMDWSVKLCM